jgi:hypothetical protein
MRNIFMYDDYGVVIGGICYVFGLELECYMRIYYGIPHIRKLYLTEGALLLRYMGVTLKVSEPVWLKLDVPGGKLIAIV